MVMFLLVYYDKSCFSSCLEGVPLEVFKKSCYCSWLSRIVVCTTSDSLSLGFF